LTSRYIFLPLHHEHIDTHHEREASVQKFCSESYCPGFGVHLALIQIIPDHKARAEQPGLFFYPYAKEEMKIHSTILKLNRELIGTFALLDSYFDRDEKYLLAPKATEWNIAQILEHVFLTNHYLLILIEKGAHRAKALAGENDLSSFINGYELENPALSEVGIHKSFEWENIAHMEPKGDRSLREIRSGLRDQLHSCLCILDSISRGEGVLYKMTMTVNNLGKLDVYQYIYFLTLHIKRHLGQLEKRQFDNQFTKG
jgi:hypothetical protein